MSKDTKMKKTEIFKYVTALLIVVYIVLMMIYTSGSTKPFDEVASKVESALDKENLVKQDMQALKRYYGLNGADYKGVLYYSSENNLSAEEVLLIEVKNDKQAQQVRDAVEERLAARKKVFDGYAPKEVQLIEEAQLKVRGNYIFLAVAPKAQEYSSAFSGSL